MKQTRFDEAQIIGILKQQEAGVTVAAICRTVAAICREHAISEGHRFAQNEELPKPNVARRAGICVGYAGGRSDLEGAENGHGEPKRTIG